MVVRIIGRVSAQEGKIEEMKELLIQLKERTKRELTCMNCTIAQDSSEKKEFTIMQTWERNDMYNKHFQSVANQEFIAKIKDLATAEPTFQTLT